MADHVQGCWEVKEAEDRGMAIGFGCLWALVTLVRCSVLGGDNTHVEWE